MVAIVYRKTSLSLMYTIATVLLVTEKLEMMPK